MLKLKFKNQDPPPPGKLADKPSAKPSDRRPLEQLLIVLAGAAAVTAILMSFDFNMLEASLYDLRMAHGFQAKADPNIVLVTLDDATTAALDELSPLTLDLHTRFLEAVEKLQPKAVGYLVDFNQVSQANPDLLSGEWGRRFLSSAARLQANGSVFLLGTPYDINGEVLPPFPLSSLPHSIAVIHKDGNVFGEDKITRRALVHLNGKPAFHLDLARKLRNSITKVSKESMPPGSFDVPEIDGKYFFFRYHGDTAMNLTGDNIAREEQPAELAYHRISFIDIINGKLPEGALREKTVLVGTLSKENASDFAFTPYSKAAFVNPKLVVHANILDSIIHHEGIRRAPVWLNWAMTFGVSSSIFWWVLNLTPLYGLFSTLSLVFFFMLFSQGLFEFRGFWIRESQPLVGMFIGYYLVVPYRLIREYKKRWAYQRKNEILTQVEELKTNFLSLVTHDLKTPVARIQGLAEVLLRKSSDRLIDRDKETLHHIISSTEELNRFISSILELSKVESRRLQLKFESKDINQLIETLVEGFKAQSRSKQIKIVTNLEPLFPIRIDANLLSKVMSNLIDNAIKYSPTGSQVSISSREVDTWVEVSIHDQGIGMTESEKESLFTRFYRAKNDTTTQVAGTGLGLYLSKFFIEAHHGRVEVVSAKDQGSTFKIYLPLQTEERDAQVDANGNTLLPGLRKRLFDRIGEHQKVWMSKVRAVAVVNADVDKENEDV